MTGYDYDYLSHSKKIDTLFNVSQVLADTMSRMQILIVPVGQTTKEAMEKLRNGLDKDNILYDKANEVIDFTAERLRKKFTMEKSNDYKTYLIVRLNLKDELEVISQVKDAAEFFIKEPKNAIDVFLRLDRYDILQMKVDKCLKLANRWLDSQQLRVGMERVSEKEMQWLYTHGNVRGLRAEGRTLYKSTISDDVWEPYYDEVEICGKKVIRPERRELVNLFNAEITPQLNYLKVESDGKTSYQTFMALSHMPDSVRFPGEEWIYDPQKYDIGAEICIHIQATHYQESLRRLENQRRAIDSQMDLVAEANGNMPRDIVDAREQLEYMESEIKEGRSPILNTCITLCVAGETIEEMEYKVTNLETLYKEGHFGLERSRGDQLQLFYQHMPTVTPSGKDYMIPRTVINLASGGIGVSRSLGDGSGRLIGYTGNESKPVYLNMGEACKSDRSASVTVYGDLGGGKSALASKLVCDNVLFGGYGLIFCPKGERAWWKSHFKLFEDVLNVVTISADKGDAGKLDPYNIYKDNNTNANELAINILTELFNISANDPRYTILKEATQQMAREENPSMLKLSEIMDNFKKEDPLYMEAKMFARQIRAHLNSESAGSIGLLFGDGTEKAISLNNRLNVIVIENLKLPEKTVPRQDYEFDEKISSVIMMVLAHFAKKFAHKPTSKFKSILFDESWMLGKTAAGSRLYEYLARMGRSLNTGTIFNGHSVLDIPSKEMKNTISYKFCFAAGDEEAGRMLEYLEMEDSPANRKIIKDLNALLKKHGIHQCLFKDLDGHIGKIETDLVLPEYRYMFNTTPGKVIEFGEDKPKSIEGQVEAIQGQVENNEPELSLETLLQKEKV